MSKPIKVCTLLWLFSRDESPCGNKVLLGMKKRGFGAGKWNGFGGKVEPGETLQHAAIREMYEESRVMVSGVKYVGFLFFEFEGSPQDLEVHVFSASHHEGIPEESDEMQPQWFPCDSIPYQEMWEDDVYWVPLLLEECFFHGKFIFRKDCLLRHDVHRVDEPFIKDPEAYVPLCASKLPQTSIEF